MFNKNSFKSSKENIIVQKKIIAWNEAPVNSNPQENEMQDNN